MDQDSDLLSKIENLYKHILSYALQTKDVFLLDIIEKTARILTDIVSSVFVAVFTTIIALFASISLAWYIGLCLESLPLGFLIVASIYLIVMLIVIAFNKSSIQPKLINYFITKLIHGYRNKES